MFAKNSKNSKLPDRVAEVVDELIDTLAPHVESARDAAAPHVHAAHEKLVNDLLPAVQAAAENAREQAAPMAAEAKARGLAATAALKGQEPPASKGGRFKKFLLVAGVAGAIAVVAKKLTGSSHEQPWESSYAPKTPSSAPNATSRTPIADGVASQPSTDDPGGGTPGEALADATDQPHQASTPDAPAEVTEIVDQPNPDRV